MAEAHIMRAIVAGRPPFKLQEEQLAKLRFHPSILQRTWDMTPSRRPAAQDFAAVVQTGLSQDFKAIPLNREIITISRESSQSRPASPIGAHADAFQLNGFKILDVVGMSCIPDRLLCCTLADSYCQGGDAYGVTI